MHRFSHYFSENGETPAERKPTAVEIIYETKLAEVENKIREIIWNNAQLHHEDEEVSVLLDKKKEIEKEFEICHKEDQLESDMEYAYAKGQLVATVGTIDSVRPVVEPLMNQRTKLKRVLRSLRKIDPNNN